MLHPRVMNSFFIHFTIKKKFRIGYDTRVMHPPSAVCVPTLSICLTTYFKFLTFLFGSL